MRAGPKPPNVVMRPRVNVVVVSAVALFTLVFGFGVGIEVALQGDTLGGVAAVICFSGVSAASAWASRMRVELGDTGARIVGYFRSRVVPWAEITGASVDYHGLHFHRQDGTRVTAMMLGKPNWAVWLGREVAADRRLAVVEEELSRRRGSSTGS